MTGDDPQVRAAQQLGHPSGDVAVAGPVKTPAADAARLGPLVRNGIETIAGRDRGVEIRFEGGHERNFRQLVGQQAHGGDVGRIVGRGNAAHFLHRR